MTSSPGLRPLRVLHGAAALAALAATPSANAIEFAFSGFEGSLDTTVSVGVQTRTQGIDDGLVGTRSRSPGDTARKGAAFSVNNDDGNLNYERGLTGTIARFTSELDISSASGVVGAFARAEGYYDPTNVTGSNTDHKELSPAARDQVAKNLRLLDAYLELNVAPRGIDSSIRAGRQVLSWGESTFIPGGINVINPVDVSQLRTPGSELRNALLPQGMLSLNIATSDNTTLEGFYQYDWKEVRIDRPGTYFSTNDFVGKGQDKAMLGFGDFSEFGTNVQALFGGAAAFTGINNILAAPTGAGLTGVSGTPYGTLPTLTAFENDWFGVPRGDNQDADDGGQFGVAFRAFVPQLNDTELGFYFINYHSRLPIISAQTASRADTITAASQIDKLAANGGAAAASAVGVNTQAQASRYFIEYPEDIKLLGTSFNTALGTTGWALQGEYSIQIDKPLQVDDVELLFASLTPLDTQLRAQTGGALSTAFTNNQLGTFGPDTVIHGFIERHVSQVQFTATKVLGPTLGADTGVFLTEVGMHYVHNLPAKSRLRLNGPGTNTSGNPAQSGTNQGHAGKDAEDWSHFPDPFSWGYRMAARLDFNNVFGLVNLSPRVQWQHDVQGVSPGPGGPFLAGRKAVSIGMRATYLESWEADLAWTGFFGAGRYNLINDRDFFAASLKYSF